MAGSDLETKWSVRDIQRAVVSYVRSDDFVPNVSFGFFQGMECDLVRVSDSDRLHEFEIKRSWGDFRADFRKKRFHDDVRICRLTFVLPESFAGDRLKKFCAENYQTFKREFDFLFYVEGGVTCGIAPVHWVPTAGYDGRLMPEERFRTETYITPEMLEVVRKNDVAAPYRRRLFLEELVKLYRLGVIRFWHRPPEPDREDNNKEAKMKATIDGIVYEGTEDEIRRIVENPPHRPPAVINHGPTMHDPTVVPPDFQRNWDGSPRLTCEAGAATGGTGGTTGTAGEDSK